MTKLQIKSDRITSFGEFVFVNRLFDSFLGKVINDTLGLRSAGYQWDEIIKSLFKHLPLCDDHIEDITSSCLVLVKLTVTFKQRHY